MGNTVTRLIVPLLLFSAISVMAQSICAGVSANDDSAARVSGSTYSAIGKSLIPDAPANRESVSATSNYDHRTILTGEKIKTPHRQSELVSQFGHSPHPEVARTVVRSIAAQSKNKHMERNNEKRRKADLDTGGSWVSLPDSTRGTGVVNPPDAGTVSPIEWNPGFSFGLPDFSDRTFLNPTLHVVANSTKRTAARKIHRATEGVARNRLSHNVTSPLNETLNPGLPHESSLHSSIQEELGQQ